MNPMNEIHGYNSYFVNDSAVPDKLAVGCVIKGCHFALYFKKSRKIYKYIKGYTSHSIGKHNYKDPEIRVAVDKQKQIKVVETSKTSKTSKTS